MLQKRSRSFSLAVTLAAGLTLTACSDEAAPPTPGAPVAGGGGGGGIRISPTEAATIGQQIWVNECGGTVAGLTSWNKGEYFASLGIGHFIWYHADKRGPFDESFPSLVRFMSSRGVGGPLLIYQPACPWKSREQFLAAQDSPEMQTLRTFLKNTIPLQTEFILQRLEAALPKMLASIPAGERALVKGRFYAVAESQKGKYALMDYVNFKGEGTKASERYRGQGWGMLQVLQEMRGTPRGPAAAAEYAAAADRVLTRRVANAPKDESRWLPGWRNRLKSYRP